MAEVYTNEVVPEQPFPQADQMSLSTSSGSNQTTTSNPTTNDNIFPVKRIAVELLNTSLNTKSKKILGDFQLQDGGGVRAGKYENGVSGEVAMTPAGLVAKNKQGETTVSILGEDGSATFKGTVQANDFVIADENGLVSASTFQSDSYRSDTELTVNGTQTFTLVSGSELELTLVRPAKVLITFFANTAISATDAFRGYYSKVGVSIDGSNPGVGGGEFSDPVTFDVEGVEVVIGSCLSFAKTYLLAQGTHTIALKWATFSDTGSTVYLRSRGLDYCMLGS